MVCCKFSFLLHIVLIMGYFHFHSSFYAHDLQIELQCRYSQAGTPLVKVVSAYNSESRTFSLKFRYIS